MMKTKPLISSAILIMILWGHVFATDYVVNQKHRSANDAGPGTKKQPLKTIGAAAGRVKAGDKILIYEGIYREGVELKISGAENNPITIEAADPGKVIMRGSVVITGWKRETGESPVFSYDGWTNYFGPATPKEKDARGMPRNQLFSDGALIQEVFQSGDLKESTFFIDKEKKQIRLWLQKEEDPNTKLIEVSDREFLINAGTNNYIVLRGIRFEHGANGPQGGRALVRVRGNNCLVEDCSMSLAAATGFGLSGKNNIVRRCVFNNNGQQGFSVSFSVDCLIQDCESSYNNNIPYKTYNINWEAGGNKLAFCYRLLMERHQAHFNNGDGLWFDISNNECEIRNCLCTNNKRSGIFWEISFAANIHDNVLMGNNSQGILLAESNGPVVERNIMIGNTNGLTFRDMIRTTSPAIDDKLARSKEEAIWNHNEVVKNNVMAFNKNSQVRGAFLNKIERMVPTALQKKQAESQRVDSMVLAAIEYQAKDEEGQPIGLSLEKLNIRVDNNVYWADTISTLYQWPEIRYKTLDEVRKDLKFEENGIVADPKFADWKKLDLRVPKDSPLIVRGCYPQGRIPGVKTGIR